MANIFKNFFSKPENSVLGVDIGSSAIKIVQIRKKNGQAVLETYGELALGPYSGAQVGQATNLPLEKIAEAVTDLMKEKEVNVTTNKCGISIPFNASLMSVIEMPAVSTKQLSVMVPIEARKYIPVPISEVTLDWSIIPKNEIRMEDNPEGESENNSTKSEELKKVDVLVVAIHNDTIAKYQEIIAKSKLDASFFEIEIFSTMRSVSDQTLAPIMILDMGAASTKLYIVERGIVHTSHTINRGSQDITLNISKSLGISIEKAEVLKREEGALSDNSQVKEIIEVTLDYIFSEANRVLLGFEQKNNKNVNKVVLVGGGSALKGFVDLAKTSFQTETFAGNPFGKLYSPAFLQNVLLETGPEFAVAIGLALRRLQEEE